jgi:hypothetical protein
MPWQYSIIDDDAEHVAAYFWVRTCRSPFLLEKIVRLQEDEPVLRIWERVTNEGQDEMHFMWGQHPVIGRPFLGPDCVVTVPAATTIIVPDPADWPSTRLKQGKYHWPIACDHLGGKIDISRIAPPNSGIADAAYLTDFADGWFAITSHENRLVFALGWSREIYPWIWYWHVAGGERGAPFFGRNYCVALEPFTSYPPSFEKALKAGTQKTLQSQQSLESELTVSIFPAAGEIRSVTSDGEILFEN